MAIDTEEDKKRVGADKYDPFEMVFGERENSTASDWAVLGCLVAGAVGIYKAFGMDNPSGVFLCLLGSVAAFGVVIYARSGRR
jgi:hypothetical protein